MGYPSRDDEWGVLARRIERRTDDVDLQPILDGPGLIAMQEAIEAVHVSESIGYYMVDIVAATRSSSRVQVGSSPRARWR